MSLENNIQAQEPTVPTESTEQLQPTTTTPTNQPKRKRRRRRSMSKKAADSSRRNGAKSTGPTTPEGRSRRNRANLIHGAFSHSDLILPEDLDRYNAILNDFIQEFRPTNHVELEIVEQMMSASWRRRRHAAVYQQYWNQSVTEVALELSAQDLSPVALSTRAHAKLAASSVNLKALEASESLESRRFLNALRHFREYQKHRDKMNLTIDPGNA